ncbi:MAG: NUDIX domain-containing protein [Phycisphaerales bacterium]|nr:NUDIX domain-containing protein [Phycisphaerales bacterium]
MMSFLQKIYYNNKPLILAEGVMDKKQFEAYICLNGANAHHFSEAIRLLDRVDIKGVVILDESREKLEKELLWAFYPLHSSGGVVLNESGDVLMIFRRGKWDLPKGKQDEGEDIEQCAVREVSEETGLKNVQIKHKICNTLHVYPMNNKLILKHTAWYLMQGSAKEQLMPQQEENIEYAMWVKPSEIRQLLENSFETITDLLVEAQIL